MAKRNQYNRSTFPQDMNISIYSSAATVVSDATFTINPDSGLIVYAGNGVGTGSLDVAAMRNGQKIDIVNASSANLRLNCTTGRVMITNFTTASFTVLAPLRSFVSYKFDSTPIADGSTQSNILFLHSSGSYTGFA